MGINVRIPKISKQLFIGALAGILLVTILVATIQNAKAATPSLSVNPISGTIRRGTIFDVQIRAYSETALNAVQANLSYSPNLEVVGISYQGSAYPVEAEGSYSGGQIYIARAAFDPITGDQLVATVSFKVVSGRSAKLTFGLDSALVSANDGRNILGSFGNGSYKVR